MVQPLPWATTTSLVPPPARSLRSSTLSGTKASPVQSVVSSTAAVSKEDVIAVQNAWAGAIKRISLVYKYNGDYVKAAADAAGELYAYGEGNVLFKPTKASEHQFRPTPEEALSYFVGRKAVDNGYAEDGGFAINGGKGWSDCVYDNHQIEIKGGVAFAMGNYYFTCATTGEKSTVEYTFGYQRCDDGKVRIFLHHSSVPYKAKEAKASSMHADQIMSTV